SCRRRICPEEHRFHAMTRQKREMYVVVLAASSVRSVLFIPPRADPPVAEATGPGIELAPLGATQGRTCCSYGANPSWMGASYRHFAPNGAQSLERSSS